MARRKNRGLLDSVAGSSNGFVRMDVCNGGVDRSMAGS